MKLENWCKEGMISRSFIEGVMSGQNTYHNTFIVSIRLY